MNILLASNFSVGSVPFYVKRGLEKLGHTVFAFSPDKAADGWQTCSVDVDLNDLVKLTNQKIDLVLSVEASSGTKFFPRGLDSVPAPTAWWGIDNHLNYRWHKEYANLFDYSFFAQKEYMQKALRYGTKNLRWLPLGCDEEIHRDQNLERIYDIGFVGNVNANRKKFFDSLGAKVNTFSGLFLEEMGKVYSQSKIVLNVSAREDLNMRAFESMAAGALLITQKIDAGIHDLFTENKHFVFHNIKDAGNIVSYYLTHDEERKAIAEAGKNEVLKNNTYAKRMEQLISIAAGDPEYLEKRKKKFSPYKIFIQESLVFGHRTFRMQNEAEKKKDEAAEKNLLMTKIYSARYIINHLIERFEKLFKINL